MVIQEQKTVGNLSLGASCDNDIRTHNFKPMVKYDGMITELCSVNAIILDMKHTSGHLRDIVVVSKYSAANIGATLSPGGYTNTTLSSQQVSKRRPVKLA
ncbi:hypothetical protein TNCV_1808561 [Trichonephila clavipes]|nr:hypothetical protein TNCV_1808561 [Trichonephila clavipes]